METGPYRRVFIYRGRSMAPALKEGDLLSAEGISLRDVRVGDIIVYRRPGEAVPVAHRVIAKTGAGHDVKVLARGDHPGAEREDVVSAESLVGRVVEISEAGGSVVDLRSVRCRVRGWIAAHLLRWKRPASLAVMKLSGWRPASRLLAAFLRGRLDPRGFRISCALFRESEAPWPTYKLMAFCRGRVVGKGSLLFPGGTSSDRYLLPGLWLHPVFRRERLEMEIRRAVERIIRYKNT